MTTQTLCMAAMLTLAACGSLPHTTGDDEGLRGAGNMWAGRWVTRAATRQAIVRQSAVYPYHFVTNSAELNALGRREVAVLAEHMRTAPGPLHVPRGDQPELLYTERVASLRAQLQSQGVSAQIPIVDGPTPMRGATGLRTVEILSEETTLDGGEGGDLTSLLP